MNLNNLEIEDLEPEDSVPEDMELRVDWSEDGVRYGDWVLVSTGTLLIHVDDLLRKTRDLGFDLASAEGRVKAEEFLRSVGHPNYYLYTALNHIGTYGFRSNHPLHLNVLVELDRLSGSL